MRGPLLALSMAVSEVPWPSARTIAGAPLHTNGRPSTRGCLVSIFIGMDLDSSRLRLRRWRPDDRAPFAAINDEPAVQRYLSPLTRAGLDAMLDRIEAHFARYGWGPWALEERTSGALIGLCGLEHIAWEAFFTPAVEIGWRL